MYIPIWVLILVNAVICWRWIFGPDWKRLFYQAGAEADRYKHERDVALSQLEYFREQRDMRNDD